MRPVAPSRCGATVETSLASTREAEAIGFAEQPVELVRARLGDGQVDVEKDEALRLSEDREIVSRRHTLAAGAENDVLVSHELILRGGPTSPPE